jgi:hypothetical protein|tara:strand:- start:19 stop:183 length:165 start_codon:yes stop_codon:yes gene_type:complete
MHELGAAEYGINRAGLDALCATNAFAFSNNCHKWLGMLAVTGVQWFISLIKQDR